jgi:hypothetical protein
MPIDASGLTPIALSFTLLMSVLTLLLPRRYVVIPLIVTACYMTLGERIIFLTLNFTIFRIILLFGWLRIIIRRDITFSLNVIDKTILWWIAISIVTAILLDPTSDALITRSGYLYNAVLSYFLIRFYVKDFDDINMILKVTALLIVPLAISMLIEKSTGRNIFSVFGGVPEITMIREGRLRCQGPFGHPILAGTFGATLMPLLVGLFFKGKGKGMRMIAVAGFISASIITFASASSGPLMAYLFGIIGFVMWPFRNHMRLIRWCLLFAVIGLHLIMKDPVWFILARLAAITGGTGWYRAELIDQAIKHVSEWWLWGTTYTAHWNPYAVLWNVNPNMIDITNQYVWEGVSGGIVRLILFITIIALSFKKVGLSLKALEDKPFAIKIMIWSVGVSLFTHVVSYISVVYFDQMFIFWFLLLSMISALPAKSEGISAKAISEMKAGEFRAI